MNRISIVFTFFILTFLSSCSSIEVKGKKIDILEAYKKWYLEPGREDLHRKDYKVKSCGRICKYSNTSRYYILVRSSGCGGHIYLEEKCLNNICTYKFDEEYAIVCS